MPGYVREFFETLTDLSKKKEFQYAVLGILLGLCIFACPLRLLFFALLGVAAVAVYTWYLAVKKDGGDGGGTIDLSKKP